MADCLAHMEWSRCVPNMEYPRQVQGSLLSRMEETWRAAWHSRQNEGWQVGSNTEHVALQWAIPAMVSPGVCVVLGSNLGLWTC